MLLRKNFNVSSYGTGSQVKLPGPSPAHPNVYPFGTPYDDIYKDLHTKNVSLYTANGLLSMLDRNRKIKKAPEKWHLDKKRVYDVVITCEERCFDSVCEDLLLRGGKKQIPVHVFNVDIRDNHEDAAVGGRIILALAQALEASQDLDGDMHQIVQDFRKRNPQTSFLYSLSYY